jgi:hypothetical protein
MDSTNRNTLNDPERVELVLALLAGETTVAQAGEQHGLDPAELESWKALYVGGLRHAARADKPSALRRLGRAARRHPLRASGAVLAGLLAFAVPLTAWSESPPGCTDPGTLNLCQFYAGEPAVAAEVNSNFSKIVGWVEQKIGPVGTADLGDVTANQVSAGTVVATDVQADGSAAVQTLDVAGNINVQGQLNIASTPLVRTFEVAGHFGEWEGPYFCAAGEFVCGMDFRLEAYQGSGDDTALNGVRVRCCAFGVAPP